MTILVIRITMNLGSLFRRAFSSVCLLSDRSHSSTLRMYCAGYKGPDVLTFPFLSCCLVTLAGHLERRASLPAAYMEIPQAEGRRGGRFLFGNILIFSSLPRKPFPRQSSRAVVAFPTTAVTSHRAQNSRHMCGHLSVCVSIQYRHLCVLRPLLASLSQSAHSDVC